MRKIQSKSRVRLLVLAAIAIAAGLLLKTQLNPGRASAAGADNPYSPVNLLRCTLEFLHLTTPEPRCPGYRTTVVETLHNQLELYKLQHHDKPPTFAMLHDWSILLNTSTADGDITPTAPFGPYMQVPPTNPVTGSSTIVPAGHAIATAGWTYDETSGVIKPIIPASRPDLVASLKGNCEIAP